MLYWINKSSTIKELVRTYHNQKGNTLIKESIQCLHSSKTNHSSNNNKILQFKI